MLPPVHTLPADSALKQAATAMVERRIRAVPILDRESGQSQLSGLLTETDLLKQIQAVEKLVVSARIDGTNARGARTMSYEKSHCHFVG